MTPAAAPSDAPWSAAATRLADEGPRAAFEAELTPVLGAAMKLAIALRLDRQDAEDAVQEAALRAWRHRASRRMGTELRPWFLAIVANQCRDSRRARWASVLRLADPPIAQPSGFEDQAGVLDASTALRQLPSKLRLAVVLRCYLDLPFEDVAATSGCTLEAARSRVRRGLAALAATLTPAEGS